MLNLIHRVSVSLALFACAVFTAICTTDVVNNEKLRIINGKLGAMDAGDIKTIESLVFSAEFAALGTFGIFTIPLLCIALGLHVLFRPSPKIKP